MQRIPQFVVGGMCGGAAYLYFVDNLHDKWHPITREIWNIQIPPKQNERRVKVSKALESIDGTDLNEIALERRHHREWYRNSFVVGWNDSVRYVHRHLIKYLFDEDLP